MRIFGYLCKKANNLNGVAPLTLKHSNLPESYVKRAMEQVYYRTPSEFPQYQKKEIKRKKYTFGTSRPWTFEFYKENTPGRVNPKIFIEPIAEWNFFLGDRVEVLVGRDKGKHGIINQIVQERNWIFVEGLNARYKTLFKEKNFPGIIILEEKPLLVTNEVNLVDPETLKATEVEWRFTEAGEKVRVSKATGRIIPIPKQAEATYDYKTKAGYFENDKDTKSEVISEATFVPKLCTFEMDIMEEMGIKEDRVPAKTYWY